MSKLGKPSIAFHAIAIIAAAAVVGLCAGSSEAALNKQEQKCLSKLSKSAIKLATTYAKGASKCLNDDVSGNNVGACPNAKNIQKNDKAIAKIIRAAEKTCFSTCSTASEVQCVTDLLCPPPEGGCTAGAKGILFDISRINYPGPFCPTVGVSSISTSTDIGTCTAGLSEQAGVDLVSAIYGSIDNASLIGAPAASCLAAMSKTAQKLTSTVAKSILKCRDSINKGKLVIAPAACEADAKTVAKIQKAETKLIDAIADNCDASMIQELDICGNGVGGTTSVLDAQICLAAAAHEVGNSNDASVNRSTAAVTIIEAAMPPVAGCGDNAINAGPNYSHSIGEECDGSDDSACPGECLPPGDLFECTCGDRARWRFEADASQTDLDAGWTGSAMDQAGGDRAGFTVTLLNCDCAAFDGPGSATCIGATSDPLCDVVGTQRPYCDWEPAAGLHCEGDVTTENAPCASNVDCGAGTCIETPHCDVRSFTPNLIDKDSDCHRCDANSVNALDACMDDGDCASQCFPIGGGAPTGGCSFQSNCGPGEVCLGRCDQTRRCIVSGDGAPYPLVGANVAVCTMTSYRENINGTLNLVTGEHELSNSFYTVGHLGEGLTRPCPVCGGMCEGGPDNLKSCTGRCRDIGGGSLDSCRFDTDCVTVGETCSSDSPDCHDEGVCNLAQVCLGSPETPSVAKGTPCEIFFVDPLLGALSTDCPADPAKNISGLGSPIEIVPGATTHQVTWTAAEPCTAAGFELFDCHCPGGGGVPSKPNSCNPTCDSGVNYGLRCGSGGIVFGTTCAAGVNVGKICDEDTDCPGSSCSNNPLSCTGDSATCLGSGAACMVDSECVLLGDQCLSANGDICTTNADCGAGVCGDACPGGRCLPLCTPRPGDLDDGVCAADSRSDFYHCTDFPGITCFEEDADAALVGDCASTCSVAGTPCGSVNDCPTGEICVGECLARGNCEAGGDGIMGSIDDKPGAGECARFPSNCQPDPVVIEGGTTLNLGGDATNVFHVGRWCFSGTNSAAINAVSGFPGPGVVERKGKAFLSVTTIP